MASVTSGRMHLTGSNELWIELIYNQSISGTTNTVSVIMRVHTRWYIEGNWQCQLTVNGSTVGPQLCTINHGSYSQENVGYSDVLSKTVQVNYTGNKTINLSAIIYGMDYTDVITGAWGVFNPSFSADIALNYITPPNQAPPIPTLSVNATKYNGNHITDAYFNVSLSQVSDPNGDTVRYVIYCDKKLPGSNSWISNGDSNHCVLWDTNKRDININTSNDTRGTQYRVWGKSEDTKGATKGNTNTISNIYRNQLPSLVPNIYPNKTNFYTDNLKISWDASTDYENMPLTYTVLVSKNNENFSQIYNKINYREITYDTSKDDLNTTYVFKIITNDVYASNSGKTSIKYIKTDNRPTAPTNINPSSGYYYGDVILSWNPSTNPTGNSISKYNVYINDTYIGNTTSTQYKYTISNNDAENTAYTISVEAVSSEGITGIKGIANGPFYKASSPKAPAYILPNEIYHDEKIELSWEKIISNNIDCEYLIDYKINNNEWKSINKISQNYFTHIITNLNRGDKIQYRIRSINSFNLTSNYAYSIIYYRNILPKAPIIEYPINNSIVFQNDPRIAITIPSKSTNQNLKLYIDINGILYNSKDNYDMFSNQEKIFTTDTKIIFKAKDLRLGNNIIKFYINDETSNSEIITINYTFKEFKVDELYISDDVYITSSLFKSILNNLNILNHNYLLDNLVLDINKDDYIYYDIINRMRNNIATIRNILNNYDYLNSNYDITSNWENISINSFITKKCIIEIIESIGNI